MDAPSFLDGGARLAPQEALGAHQGVVGIRVPALSRDLGIGQPRGPEPERAAITVLTSEGGGVRSHVTSPTSQVAGKANSYAPPPVPTRNAPNVNGCQKERSTLVLLSD